MRNLLIGLVRVYRWVFSPALRLLLGTSGCCRYSPTCSCYAMEALHEHGAINGLRLTFGRLLRCHPWGGAGYDPVPRANSRGALNLKAQIARELELGFGQDRHREHLGMVGTKGNFRIS